MYVYVCMIVGLCMHNCVVTKGKVSGGYQSKRLAAVVFEGKGGLVVNVYSVQ